ncbi:MAG: polysaccharide deacetylase family protein [Atopobiaceae bacterium]|nr:polysaccharide deacetylase family protein [Atopobiaceae bacterium]
MSPHNNDEHTQQTTRSSNPYDNADPIPMTPRNAHQVVRDHPSTYSRPRSRTVQSAQDSARLGSTGQFSRIDETDGPRIIPARQRSSESSSRTMSSRAHNANPGRRRIAIIVALAAILLVAGGITTMLWLRRPVTITVNGKTAEYAVGTTLRDIMNDRGIITNPGNYVTVSGEVLEPHNGYAYSARINGEQVPSEELEDYRISGSESIEYLDGEDRIEEYTVTTESIAPYLRMEGQGYTISYVSQWPREGILEHRTGTVSGEQVDVVTQETQDCIVTCRDFNLEGDRKYVALTFDDGPSSPYTEQYLDILERYGVRATFFFLGESVEQNPELARKVVEAGHQVANHTMAHNQLTAVDGETVRAEVRRSAEVIERDCGVATTHLRPPYGDFTERSWLATGGDVSASVRWSGDSEDWRLPGADAIVENALVNVHSGTVILMHDGGGDRSQDVEALPRLIERLQGDGYEFVTVSDLMRAAGDIPEDVCSGSAAMPEGCTWPDEIAPEDIEAASGT